MKITTISFGRPGDWKEEGREEEEKEPYAPITFGSEDEEDEGEYKASWEESDPEEQSEEKDKEESVKAEESEPPEKTLWEAAATEGAEVGRILRENPTLDVNWKNDHILWGFGRAALHMASSKGSDKIVAMLKAHPDIDVNIRDGSEFTPLVTACYGGHAAVVRLLLHDERVDLDASDYGRRTAFYLAASRGHLDAVKWWIASGREIDLTAGNVVERTRNPTRENYESDRTLAERAVLLPPMVALLERLEENPELTRTEIRHELGITGETPSLCLPYAPLRHPLH